VSSSPAAPPVAAVVLGTRSSVLARAQTRRVIELLGSAWPGLTCRAKPIVTRGDRTQESGEPLPAIGGKGLFTAELERSLRSGEIDLAVHSLKDLPTEDTPGVLVGAVCAREDARDCLVSREGLTLAELPAGSVVGTSSQRRAAQLRAVRPELDVRSIRGNVDTRIRKVQTGEYDAAVLAAAGIVRLELEGEVTEWLPLETMLPAPGQGALAVQCREGDERVLALLSAIDDAGTRAATAAERAFLRALGAGCTAPVAAHGVLVGDRVRMRALVASADGGEVVRVSGEGAPNELGTGLAREALAAGADRIFSEIRGSLPLRGRRIVVTRPRRQARGLIEELERLGAVAPLVPLVAVQPPEDPGPLDAAVDALDRYDWLVFTSTNGVAAVRDRLEAVGGRLGKVRVATVGPATAAAASALGAEPSFVPARFNSEDLARGLTPLEGARVLLPQADIASPRLAEELRAQGATVDAVVAYSTVAEEPSPAELAELESGADAVVLASGSAAGSLAALAAASEHVRHALGTALLVCVGPKTAAVVREVGLPVGLVADEATADGIIRALVTHFGMST
jgi:hydroxymethylbilane synthase